MLALTIAVAVAATVGLAVPIVYNVQVGEKFYYEDTSSKKYFSWYLVALGYIVWAVACALSWYWFALTYQG